MGFPVRAEELDHCCLRFGDVARVVPVKQVFSGVYVDLDLGVELEELHADSADNVDILKIVKEKSITPVKARVNRYVWNTHARMST